jgi:outer membrane protein assembly factor BamB
VADEDVGAELWRADLGTRLIKPRCYPICTDDRYILGTEDGTLLALDPNGKLAWEHTLEEGRMVHALSSGGERVFVGCEDTQTIPTPRKALLALDPRTGEELWQYETPAHSLSAAAVSQGFVYFTTSDGMLYAVDAATGRKQWAVEHPIWGPTPPVVGEGVVCAGGRGNSLIAYEIDDGKIRWRFSGEGWFATPLIIADGHLYALSWDDRLYVLEIATGRTAWVLEGERSRGLTSPPAVSNGRVFVGSRVYCRVEGERERGYAMLALDAEDDTELWRFHTASHIFTPPNVVEDTLFFGSRDGLFYAVDARSGEEHWHVETQSRTVTKPQILDDVVIFGGRDGIIHAVRWRAKPEEEITSPEVYEQEQQHAKAAKAYALGGAFAQAAAIFEHKLGQRREAAQLYEQAGQLKEAAHLWEELKELKRACDIYREVGDKRGEARVVEQMGNPLQAARLYEKIGELKRAASLYKEAGDRNRAADLYRQTGELNKALTIWSSLGEWEKRAKTFINEGRLAEAARILEENAQIERAADLYEEAGELEQALRLGRERQDWESVANLAARLGKYEQAAEAYEQLGQIKNAADGYKQAAEQAVTEKLLDREEVAKLYERAARLYDRLYHDENEKVCRRQVRRFRRLPDLVVRVQAEDVFIEGEWNVLNLEVENAGFGTACNIDIALSDNFETRHVVSVEGVRENKRKPLKMHTRPLEGEVGERVPLDIIVTYEDLRGNHYEVRQVTSVHVARPSRGFLGRETPFEVHLYGDMIEPGAKKVAGHEVQSGGQVGDKVEIRRGESRGVSIQSDETGEKVQFQRREGVRRCPDCNLPIQDPEQRYCPDCGAPLDEETDR